MYDLVTFELGTLSLPASGPVRWDVRVELEQTPDGGPPPAKRMPFFVVVPRTHAPIDPAALLAAALNFGRTGELPVLAELYSIPRRVWPPDQATGRRRDLTDGMDAVFAEYASLVKMADGARSKLLRGLHELVDLRPVTLVHPNVRSAAIEVAERAGAHVSGTDARTVLATIQQLPRAKGRPVGPVQPTPDELAILELLVHQREGKRQHQVAHRFVNALLSAQESWPEGSVPATWLRGIRKRLKDRGIIPYAVPLEDYPIPIAPHVEAAWERCAQLPSYRKAGYGSPAHHQAAWREALVEFTAGPVIEQCMVVACGGNLDRFDPYEPPCESGGPNLTLPWAAHRYSSSQSSSSSSDSSS